MKNNIFNKLYQDKRGQFESIIYAIILIFIVAIIFLFSTHINREIYSGFDNYLSGSEYNDTESHQALEKIEDVENSRIWDYAFLAIYFGLIIQIIMFSFATRINIAFYWLMVIIDIPILTMGVALSNIWQEYAADPVFASTITDFPITNALLGTYFPIGIVILIFLAAVILFGKPSEGVF